VIEPKRLVIESQRLVIESEATGDRVENDW
jgi:hypothetical protein